MIDIQLYCEKDDMILSGYLDKFKALVWSFYDPSKHEWITKPTLATEHTNVEGHFMLHAQFKTITPATGKEPQKIASTRTCRLAE